jgi:respiratory nitrate reductase gamma subunit
MLDNFFFVALPYIAILLFVGGSSYRAFTGAHTAYRGKWTWSARGDFLWTTRSTGFFGRASIGPAALSLHWGVLILVVAHVVGFIGGAGGWPLLVDFFRWSGLFGGVLLLYGASWALVRRLVSPQLRAMSTGEDYVVLLFLIVVTGLGLFHSVVQLSFGVSYSVGPWLVSVLTLQPDAGLVAGASLVVKLHVITNLVFMAYFPFSKLVHAFSFPVAYFTRPYIAVRSYAGLKR